MASGYARTTTVPVERTQAQLEQVLMKHGATQFVRGWDEAQAMAKVAFTLEGRQVRLTLPLDVPDEYNGTLLQNQKAADQANRAKWRSLLLVVKAKLIAVEDGISTIEREFMADVVLPNGNTLSEWAAPQLAVAYETGAMPALMPGGS